MYIQATLYKRSIKGYNIKLNKKCPEMEAQDISVD